jgi:hypothetical protein
MKNPLLNNRLLFCILILVSGACSRNESTYEEQVRVDEPSPMDTTNGISGNVSFSQLMIKPHTVVLTGMPQHRLLTLYKTDTLGRSYEDEGWQSYDQQAEAYYQTEATYLMPGIDYIRGYNLLNVAHYDITTEKTNFFFDHPVLVRSLYIPSYEQDSLYEKPVTRNYYLVSVYDADTNADTLITKDDLRRFYRFNAEVTEKTQLIPSDYSVVRSQYDPKNDFMYIFARLDADKNGVIDKIEPTHTFWISLKDPQVAKRIY